MRRTLAGSAAFLAMTGTVLILPVYAAPLPEAHAVAPSIEEVPLGSVTAPEGEAVVTEDGEPVAVAAAPETSQSPAPETAAPATAGPATSAPATAVPETEAPGTTAPGTTAPGTTSPERSASPTPEADEEISAEDVASSGDELPGVPALTVSQPDTDEFSSVGVTWTQGGVTDIVVQLRVKDEDDDWGAWTTLEADDIERTESAPTATEVRGGTAPYWTGEAHGVEVIVQGAGGVTPKDVRVALIDPGESAADSAPAGGTATDTAGAAGAMPAVYSRAQWGAAENLRTWGPEYPATLKAATVHHTADRNNYTEAEVFGMMRSIYAYHTVTRGWGDIGYNVIVDRFGRIFEGRYGGLASTVVGAHAGGFNTGTFGVSMLGNYEAVPVPQATVDAVSAIIAWKFDLYGIDPFGSTSLVSGGGGTAKYAAGVRVALPTIFGHRDVGNTACPGVHGYARLGEIRDQVALRSTANPSNIATTRRDASTGFIPDVSPVQLSSVVAANGATTLFVRGADSSIWYRTGTPGGSWGDWRSIPGTYATSGPAAVTWDGSQVDVVVRGGDGAYWRTMGLLDSAGRPAGFGMWQSLGGVFTSAPSIASLSPGRLSVAGRGGDGAVYQLLWNGFHWSGWTSLTGTVHSAPAIAADTRHSRYLVTATGPDGRVWQVGTSASAAGAAGGWVGGAIPSTHTPGTSGASWRSGSATLLSLATASHMPVILRPDGVLKPLGGQMTSVVSVAQQPDGSAYVFGRGTDGGIWMTRFANGRGGTWSSLGGQVL